MVKNNLTGAHYGLGTWLLQRLTAIIMLCAMIVFLGVIVFLANKANASFVSWQIMFHQTWLRICIQMFFIALILHAWVGIRDIWMDYVKSSALKLFLHMMTILWLLMSFIYSIKVIWL